LVGVCYRAPVNNIEKINALLQLFSDLIWNNATNVMIIGDFKWPKVDLVNYFTEKSEASLESRFLETTQDLFLVQHVNTRTRINCVGSENILDLLFTDDENIIYDLETTAPLGRSVHVGLVWNLLVNVETNKDNLSLIFGEEIMII